MKLLNVNSKNLSEKSRSIKKKYQGFLEMKFHKIVLTRNTYISRSIPNPRNNVSQANSNEFK